MYEWRKMTWQQRAKALVRRQKQHAPMHSPAHLDLGAATYHLSAACYEHAPILGTPSDRMEAFTAALLQTLHAVVHDIHAWCVLPNHYHLLVTAPDLAGIRAALRLLHGRVAHQWNGDDGTRGRKVWFNWTERFIRSERHFWATMNYIHHNPVHHGYVRRWQEWPFSSAAAFLETVGRDEAERIWQFYPIWDYGQKWDPPKGKPTPNT